MHIASISQDPSIERKTMKEVPIRKVPWEEIRRLDQQNFYCFSKEFDYMGSYNKSLDLSVSYWPNF